MCVRAVCVRARVCGVLPWPPSQEDLQTVIPALDLPVRVVGGARHRGHTGVLAGVDEDGECLSVRLGDGTLVDGLSYDDVCKLDEDMEAKRLAKAAEKAAAKAAKKHKAA